MGALLALLKQSRKQILIKARGRGWLRRRLAGLWPFLSLNFLSCSKAAAVQAAQGHGMDYAYVCSSHLLMRPPHVCLAEVLPGVAEGSTPDSITAFFQTVDQVLSRAPEWSFPSQKARKLCGRLERLCARLTFLSALTCVPICTYM